MFITNVINAFFQRFTDTINFIKNNNHKDINI